MGHLRYIIAAAQLTFQSIRASGGSLKARDEVQHALARAENLKQLESESSKALMIVNLNPVSPNESLCSLRFAAKVNYCKSSKE